MGNFPNIGIIPVNRSVNKQTTRSNYIVNHSGTGRFSPNFAHLFANNWLIIGSIYLLVPFDIQNLRRNKNNLLIFSIYLKSTCAACIDFCEKYQWVVMGYDFSCLWRKRICSVVRESAFTVQKVKMSCVWFPKGRGLFGVRKCLLMTSR